MLTKNGGTMLAWGSQYWRRLGPQHAGSKLVRATIATARRLRV